MSRVTDVEVFVKVVETTSFSRAGEATGLSRSQVSRMIAALEERLGVRLLHRTTRKVAVTASGEAFFQASVPHLNGLAEAEARVREEARAAMGTLRVSMPAAFGLTWMLDSLRAFQELHPDVRVVAQFDDRKVDLLAEGIDLAVRGGELLDGHLVARLLWPFRLLPAASPAYLARHGAPTHPSELADHACLLYGGSAQPGAWILSSGEQRVAVSVNGPLVFDSSIALVHAAVAGGGIVNLPDWALRASLQSGELVRVLPAWSGATYRFWLVRPDRRHVPERVRAFQAHLLAMFPDPPWLDIA